MTSSKTTVRFWSKSDAKSFADSLRAGRKGYKNLSSIRTEIQDGKQMPYCVHLTFCSSDEWKEALLGGEETSVFPEARRKRLSYERWLFQKIDENKAKGKDNSWLYSEVERLHSCQSGTPGSH
jgi:hypothetical protein